MNHDAELAVLRAQVEALQQEQELLLYTATHDLRTPVMTILGFADMLLSDWQQDGENQPQGRQYLERIRSAAHRQSNMIQDLQRIAQLQSQTLQPQMLDLSAMAAAQLNTLIDARSNIAVNIAASPHLRGDLEIIQVALNALLSNALRLAASAQSPAIAFGAELQKDESVFYVRNNGNGFDLGQDQTLLGLFRRLQAGTEFAGAGIALLTATLIIHRHGGRLWIDSQPDHGTTIYFRLGAGSI